MIGCLFVRDGPLLPGRCRRGPVAQLAPDIVQGKSYDLADPAVAGYFADVLRLTLGAVVNCASASPGTGPGRYSVTRGWRRTGWDSSPSRLQAAHIRPVARGGEHRLDNGLLLRSTAGACL